MTKDLSEHEEAKRCYDDQHDVGTPRVSCGCFIGSDGYTTLFQNNEEVKDKWWQRKVKKMKALGGSDLKNFLRHMQNKKAPRLQFHYDPKSYALNSDDGGAHNMPH